MRDIKRGGQCGRGYFLHEVLVKRLLLIALVILVLTPRLAQAVCHLYVMPIIGAGTRANPLRPDFLTVTPVEWSIVRWGPQPVGLVSADVTNPQDVQLSGRIDVIKIPDNLDSQLGANALTVQTALENRHIPAGWVVGTLTYRQTLRTIINMFLFFQRWRGITKITTAQIGQSGVTLDTQFQDLGPVVRRGLLDTGASFSLDTSGLSGASTLRAIFKNVADQMADKPVVFGCSVV